MVKWAIAFVPVVILWLIMSAAILIVGLVIRKLTSPD
jgi:hypothetical protein